MELVKLVAAVTFVAAGLAEKLDRVDRVDSNVYTVNTIQHLLAVRMVLCYLGLNRRCKICHCLQGGALATTNMTGHGGKSSLSTQEVRRVDSKYCQVLRGPRIQQVRAQNRGKSGKLAPDLGGATGCRISWACK